MRVNSVVWLVAYREPDEDTYQTDDYIYDDFQDAFDACVELQTHDPMCDPRIVQVILDPQHMRNVLGRARQELQRVLDTTAAGPYKKGVEEAARVVEELATPIDQGELENGGAL